MSGTGIYQIEAQSYGILGTASHDFWMLRNPDGSIAQELHGLAYDPATKEILTVGIIGDDLRFFAFDHYYGDTDNRDSSIVYQGTEADVLARWNAAFSITDYFNSLHLPYTPLGFIDPFGTVINSNSAYHIFAEIMGIPVWDFGYRYEPGLDTGLEYILRNYGNQDVRPPQILLDKLFDILNSPTYNGGIISLYNSRLIFGSNSADTLEGNINSNHIYGMGGNDTLIGAGGNDILEGGKGNDTYRLQAAGGVDTILDHSGADRLQIDGKGVSGAFRPAVEGGQVYYSADQAYELRPLPGGEWRVSARDAAAGEYKAVAGIDHWQPGEFGVTLGAAATVDRAPPLSLPVSVNYLHMNGSAASKGVQFDGGTKSDSFYGSNYSDIINTGGGPSNYVINANGGDDRVQGGDGQDFISTGSNFPSRTAPVSDNDLAFGGAKSDVLLGGYGSDQLWGDADNGNWLAAAADSGQRGDWLGGEGGNDSLHGSRGSDVAFGGAGEDLLQGGAGGDLLLGDAQYAPRAGATSLPSSAFTSSYIWNIATAGMVKGSYSADPVAVASTNAFSWVAPNGGGDVLDGGAGDDWMAGQTGGDTLDGGEGDDILVLSPLWCFDGFGATLAIMAPPGGYPRPGGGDAGRILRTPSPRRRSRARRPSSIQDRTVSLGPAQPAARIRKVDPLRLHHERHNILRH
jgi:Ca2+-binding RTX toxin-like protein